MSIVDKRSKTDRKAKSKRKLLIGAGIALGLCILGYGAVMLGLRWSAAVKNVDRKMHQVTLIKPPPPPPPPEIKEKPPEIKQEQKLEKIETPEDKPEEQQDNAPLDDNLGLDAEGGAGGDSFGLVGKKGASSIIDQGTTVGGRSKSDLMHQFGWYNQIVERELRKRLDEFMDAEGWSPTGSLRTTVELFVDEQGRIERCALKGSSGNQRMDELVLRMLETAKISQRPPEGMPRGIRLTISSRG